MGCFQDWRKIYLFYGLIFFLLGWVGVNLSASRGLTGLGAGFRGFAADLRSYTAVTPDAASPAVAVFAPAAPATIEIFYPERLAKCFVAPLPQLQKRLARRFARVEMKAVNRNVNFAEWFAGRVVKYPGQVVVGLELINSQPQRSEVHLWLRTVTAPPLAELANKLDFLPDAAKITVNLQQTSGFLWEVSWVETDPSGSTIPIVVAVGAETIISQDGASFEQQPVLQ
jgi:hypothetical protein